MEKSDRMSSYEQAFNRIRAEFMEMPSMRLTLEQVDACPASVPRCAGWSSMISCAPGSWRLASVTHMRDRQISIG